MGITSDVNICFPLHMLAIIYTFSKRQA
uniref:Uncharacterized protein n=1 Tax=Anguilla anguilla TaxID=7936 RepID=A0A0E9T7M1_ANGAN